MLKLKRQRVSCVGVLGYGSVGLLVVLGLSLLFPVVQVGSSALGEGTALVSGLTTKTTAYLYSTIALSTSGQVDIDIVPKSTGSLGTGMAEVKVSTNNTTGYSMFLSTVDHSNRLNQIDTNLQYSGSATEHYIDTLATTTTADSYLQSSSNLNTWGYALTTEDVNGSTEYQGLSGSAGDQIYTTKGTSSNDSYNLNIAVAVDTTLPAGGYRNGLVITAVANPIILSGFNQIYYMQDMTPAVCESAEMESTAQLVDKRDNKLYWVAKLKDGNCWMTQNLALDLSTEVVLTSEDSDVGSSWTPNRSTERNIPVASISDYDVERSWNLGNIVLTQPIYGDCGNIMAGTEITSCNLYMDVDGWSPDYEMKDSDTSSISGRSYDAHYLVGNYYQYNAATAGTGKGMYNSNEAKTDPDKLIDAPDSICPKGWELPTSGRQMDNAAGWPFDREDSFYRLLYAYGYPKTGDATTGSTTPVNGWTTTSWGGGAFAAWSYVASLGASRIMLNPMHFVHGGAIEVANGKLSSAGVNGDYWSKTPIAVVSGKSGFTLHFWQEDVYPSYSMSYLNGLSVRCLAK